MHTDPLVYDADDGSAEILGVVTPKGARVVMESGLPPRHLRGGGPGLIAVKWPGHHYFGGTGQPQIYAPAEFVVYEVVRYDPEWEEAQRYGQPDDRNKIRLDVRERMRWPLRG